MYSKRQDIGLCICGILLMAVMSFTGCSEKKREYIPESSEQITEKKPSSSGVKIEIVTYSEEYSEEESGVAESSEEETELEELQQEETLEEETEPAKIWLEEMYPGQVLEKADIEAIGADEFFAVSPIEESVFRRMNGNSYKEGCPVTVEDLRYLRILHYDFGGNIRVGELVCNQSVSSDMLRIFKRLYEAEYPIDKVLLIDDYGADDDISSSDNNTSCFNYRTVAGTSSLSLHALGVAIDINPLYNPYITWDEEGTAHCAPANGAEYMDRSQSFPYKIDEGDICYQLFTEAGFTWGGSWETNPDYMHFSRGITPEQ